MGIIETPPAAETSIVIQTSCVNFSGNHIIYM